MENETDFPSAIWVTWERQTRNRSASNYIGVPLWEIVYDERRALARYIKSSYATLKLIIRHSPNYVFAQNPSVVLCVLALLCSKIFHFRLIIDAHNSGVYSEGRFKFIANLLNKIIIKKSNFVIVTNKNIARTVEEIGGRPLILPDPLPSIPKPNSEKVKQKSNLNNNEKRLTAFCITSWGEDEPIEALISAAKNFNSSVNFYFTGNYRKSNLDILDKKIPSNVHLLGFIDEDEYFALLLDCDFCIDLTTRPDCLVCGAYESVAAERPILLSDTEPQRNYFTKGAVFCNTDIQGIQAGLHAMVKDLSEHQDSVIAFKSEVLEREERRRSDFVSSIKS